MSRPGLPIPGWRALTPGGKALAVGVPVVAVTYLAFWTGMSIQRRRQGPSESKPTAGRTWEHTVKTGLQPLNHADSPSSLRDQLFSIAGQPPRSK